jgi:hypothetical protein
MPWVGQFVVAEVGQFLLAVDTTVAFAASDDVRWRGRVAERRLPWIAGITPPFVAHHRSIRIVHPIVCRACRTPIRQP